MGNGITDPDQFQAAWEQLFPAVVRYVACRVGPHAAEDVVSAVWLAAYEGRRSYVEYHARGPLPWVLGIATNVIGQHYRAEQRWLGRLERAALAIERADDGLEDAAGYSSLRSVLLAAVNGLPDSQRDAFLLHVLGDLTYAEIGSAVNISQGTAKSRVSRARGRLAQAMEVHHP